jgi:hypothetical protein
LKTIFLSLAGLTLCTLALLVYIQYIRNSLYSWTLTELKITPSASNPTKEWYNLSWLENENGEKLEPNPIRVIALGEKMSDSMDPFRAAMHMTSSFYSQVKYLVKQGKIPTAIAFFLESKKWSHLALQRRKHANKKPSPIDYEVLGAPDFMLAKIPVIGRFWKKGAIEFLNVADKELNEILKKSDVTRLEPISAALIWSKLYALTGNEIYKNRVRVATLTRDQDCNQMLRIAKHLGFRTLDEFYKFLII